MGFHLSFKSMSKSKKTLETSLDLAPSMKTSVDAMFEGLVSNMNCLDNRHRNFNQKKYGRNRCHTHVLLTTVIFPFAWTFYTFDEKRKKRMLSPSSLNSFYYFSLFYRIEFKTQFKIEFCPPVNGGQLWCWNKPWHVWHVISFVGITTFRK